MRKERSQYVSQVALSNFATSFTGSIEQREAELEAQKQDVIRGYVASQQYRTDFLEALRPQILKGLSFVHDYKQINAAINQNINVLLETRYQGGTLEDKLAKAAEYEKAIYWAAKILVEKLSAARFLIHPDAINKRSDYTKFRFHGLVHKYVRIFTPRFQEKKVQHYVSGTSYAELVANGEAVGVIPQTFLDNALKYSAPGSKVEILVEDRADHVQFSVTSHGPRIFDDEKERIFEPFYRGRAAEAQEEEGAGYGLYLAQLIAREHLGTKIEMVQDPTGKPKFGYMTTFAVDLPLRAANIR